MPNLGIGRPLMSAEEDELVHYLNRMERAGLASLMCVYFLNFLLFNDRAVFTSISVRLSRGCDDWWWGRWRECVRSRSRACRHHFPLCFPGVICVALSFVRGRKNRLVQMYQPMRRHTMVIFTSHRCLAVYPLCPLPRLNIVGARLSSLAQQQRHHRQGVHNIIFRLQYKVGRGATVENRR
jgi:hypothetical protein